MQFNSLECQDEFVYALLGHQTTGIFLDIGCQDPIGANNTYAFEQLGWTGLAFDRSTVTHWDNKHISWQEKRSTPRFILDATTDELTQCLKQNLSKQCIVDYISLDIDDNGGLNYAIEGLLRILAAGIEFKIITLEHEAYRNNQSNGEEVRAVTRYLLQKLDYQYLFSDVCLKSEDGKILLPFEDWWINPKYFPPHLWNYAGNNLYYKDCIHKLENYHV